MSTMRIYQPDPGLNLAVSDTRWVPNVSSPSIRPDPGVDLHKLQETNTPSWFA
ncbi:hypothetical protein BDZ89DRAFT_1139900 [Hymenopellis radicata]|nr:hypothetical protein BDZ89DRAFT_1139900 [Hymenopellis radicata]